MARAVDLPPPPSLDAIVDAGPVALFLDFDGTLIEIADTPDAITVSPGLASRLAAVSSALFLLAQFRGEFRAEILRLEDGSDLDLVRAHQRAMRAERAALDPVDRLGGVGQAAVGKQAHHDTIGVGAGGIRAVQAKFEAHGQLTVTIHKPRF